MVVGGVDLRDYSVEDLHRQIGVIFQDFVRYEMTAGQNIAAGRVGAAEERAIRYAAKKSGADEVVERLPSGYEQLLGRRFEGGVDLSGGEGQKKALARANLREGQIPILGEPAAPLPTRPKKRAVTPFHQLPQE